MISPIHKNDKIAIIGAGPSGVHMGYLLKQKGYQNITLFEKNNRIGGKSYSIEENNIIHEMGTCYFTVTYKRILELILKHHLSDYVEIPGSKRQCFYGEPEHKELTAHWLLDKISEKTWPMMARYLPIKLGIINLFYKIKKYGEVLNQYYSPSEYDIPQNAKEEYAEHLSIPMSVFLKMHHLSELEPLFLLQNSSMCYGYPETIPAYYGIYWMNKLLLDTYLRHSMPFNNHSLMKMLKEGYQSIWEKLAKFSQLNIYFNTTIEHIERHETSNNGVSIFYQQNNYPDILKEDFDYVISAISAKEMLQLIDKPSAKEKTLFGNQICSKVVTSLINVDNQSVDDVIVYFPENINKEHDNNVIAFRNSAAVFTPNYQKHQQTLVAYQYYDDESNFESQSAENGLVKSLSSHDIKIEKTIVSSLWNYFPRFTSSGILQKLPWEIIREQGKLHTYYIGSSVSFESVNAVVNYNYYLTDSLGI